MGVPFDALYEHANDYDYEYDYDHSPRNARKIIQSPRKQYSIHENQITRRVTKKTASGQAHKGS
jgi:hypothetical protein